MRVVFRAGGRLPSKRSQRSVSISNAIRLTYRLTYILTHIVDVATRLRRDEFGGYQRRGKAKSKSRGLSSVPNDYDGDTDVAEDEHEDSHPPGPKRRRLASKNPTIKQESPTTLCVPVHPVCCTL